MKYNQKSIVVLNFLKYPIDSKCKSMGPREESARVEKIRQLKENQQKWLRERQACCDVANAVESTGGLRTTCNPHDKQNDVVNPVNLLNKITERITGRLRDEIAVEIRRSNNEMNKNPEEQSSALAAHLETYMSSELHTHSCQICFELMLPPLKPPTLLFPCGHTFCKECVEKNAESSKNGRGSAKCPYCREKISSVAPNHSLRQLIERFAKETERVERGEVGEVEGLFVDENYPNNRVEGPVRSEGGGYGSKKKMFESKDELIVKDKRKYKAEYDSFFMRARILENEREEQRAQLEGIGKRQLAVNKMIELLQKEREEVEKKRALLDDEMALIEKHLATQTEKQEGIMKEERELKEGLGYVEESLDGLRVRIEKARVLGGIDGEE